MIGKAIELLVGYFSVEGDYYEARFVSHSCYTTWLNSNKGVRVMRVEIV